MIDIIAENINLIVLIGTLIGMATAGVAFIYERGKKRGIDTACADRIEDKLIRLKTKVDTETGKADHAHEELHNKIDGISLNVANLSGKVDTLIDTLK